MSDTVEIDSAPFVTFYSFKGGVGRSMALINFAGIMAGRGFRALVIDLDLEAPGLSFLASHQQLENSTQVPGFIDLMQQAVDVGADADLFRLSPKDLVGQYSRDYPIPPEIRKSDEGSLRIMQAGKFDGAYQARLNKLNLPELYQQGRGQPLIELLKSRIQESKTFDIVLVDSRTGFSDESGICTRDLADQVVLISGLNHQNLEGSANFLRVLREEMEENCQDPVVVFSPIPNGEDDLVDEREGVAQERFSDAWGRNLSFDLRIPYHPRLALTEEPHIFRRSRGYLYEAYIDLGRAVERSIGFSAKAFASQATKALHADRFDAALAFLRKARKLEGQAEIGEFTYSLQERLSEDGFADKAASLLNNVPSLLSPSAFETRSLAETLHKKRSEHANQFYAQILKDGLENARILGNYATFLTDVRGDQDKAEAFYKRALEAKPKNADILGNYANFLQDVRGDHDKAEAFYKRALEADPDHANNLGNYANFLNNVRSDHDEAEALYKRALEADLKNANHLGNYATFLTDVRGDHDEAEAFYKRALEMDPENVRILGNYANFLQDVRGDHDEAEALYKRALEADPKNANHLGNYAKLLFLSDRKTEGETVISQALARISADTLDLLSELLFYLSAHAAESYPKALPFLKSALHAGARSPGWRLDRNIEQARRDGYSEPELLHAIATVVSDEADLDTLNSYETWRYTEAIPYNNIFEQRENVDDPLDIFV